MIRIIFSKIFASALVIAGLCGAAFAQTDMLTEWQVPTVGSLPLHIVAASSSVFYFSESSADRITQLNAATNTFTEWKLPNGGMPHGVVLPSGSLAFCAFGGNYVGILNPITSQLTEWPVPTPSSGTIHLDVSGSSFFFTEANGNKIGLLNPVTAQVTEWPIPTLSSLPRGIAVGQGTQVFFIELGTQKLGMVDTAANTITEWTILPPFKGVEHVRFSGGLVYFGDLNSNLVGTLNPATNVLTWWGAPTINANIPDVYVSSGLINFSERTGNKIGVLNPALQLAKTKTLTPVVTAAQPVTTNVVSSLVNVKATPTVVMPTVTLLNGVLTGGFTEWTLPMTGSGPLGITGVGNMLVFTEYYGDRIATLAPAARVAAAMANP